MKKENLQPHDWFFKIVFSNPKSVKTLLDIFLPKLSKKIGIDSLKLVNIDIEAVPKIHIVILQPANNLLFFFSSQKSKEEILRTYVLRMTDMENGR